MKEKEEKSGSKVTPLMAEGFPIPKWYCPFKLTEGYLGTFQPLVFLCGLDLSLHRPIWEILNLHSNKDFCPKYLPITLDHNLPVKKPRRDPAENYIPNGLLPSNWTEKHRELIPGVLIVFITNLTASRDKMIERLKEFRGECNVHGTQLLVVLMEGLEEELSTEKASSLCAAAEIPPKSLFILPQSHPDRIQTCVHRLENGIKEAAKCYYSARVRRVKNWKERTAPSQLSLVIRYNFKLGFFHEIRRDYVAAMSHYEGTIEALKSIRCNHMNIQEVKVIAALANYRLCRLHLLRMEGKEAKTQFDKCIHSFLFQADGSAELKFEHLAWLEQQYHNFGELLKEHHRKGSTLSPDPVTYFLMAAKYSRQRYTYVEQNLKAQEWPKELDGFKEITEGKYVGQRPWTDSNLEISKIVQALKYLESISPHSNAVISHLGIASDFCKDYRPRTRCQLMTMMGLEFCKSKEYSRSIILSTHVVHEFGSEKWSSVIHAAAQVGLMAAEADADISHYINFLIILLKADLQSIVGVEQRVLLWNNFQALLNKQIPKPLHPNNFDVIKWKQKLEDSSKVTSYVRVHRGCILEAKVSFAQESVCINSEALVKFVLTNRHDSALQIRKLGIQTNLSEYDCELFLSSALSLQPGEVGQAELKINPKSRDIGKTIQIQVASVDIGNPEISVLLHYSLIVNSNPTLWNDSSSSCASDCRNLIKVEGPKAQLDLQINHKSPVLFGEFHKIQVTFENQHSSSISRLNSAFQTTSVQLQEVRLRLNQGQSSVGHPQSSLPSSTQILPELESLGTLSSHKALLFLEAKTETEVGFIVKAKYLDPHGELISIEKSLVFEVLRPFLLSQETRDLQGDSLSRLSQRQEFLHEFHIQNTSCVTLTLLKASVQLETDEMELIKQTTPGSGDEELNNLLFHSGLNENGEKRLQNGETISSFLILVLKSFISNHVRSKIDDKIGNIKLTWRRDEEEEGMESETLLELKLSQEIKCESSELYLKGEMAGRTLKRPMSLSFLLNNPSGQIMDLVLSMDSTEYFMNAGPKKLNIKLVGEDHLEFSYILFPLKTGLLSVPKLLVERLNSDLPLIVIRDVPKTVFVTRESSGAQS